MSKLVLPQTRRGWFQNLLDGIGQLIQGGFLDGADKLIKTAQEQQNAATPAQIAELHFHNGNAKIARGNIEEGLELLKLATSLDAVTPFIKINAAIALTNCSYFSDAKDMVGQILDDPDFGPGAWQCYYYISQMAHQATRAERAEAARAYGQYLQGRGLVEQDAVPLAPVTGRKIRIGYFHSRWFYAPHNLMLMPILRHHDRSRFSVYCYCGSGSFDGVPAGGEGAAENWVSLAGMKTDEAYDRIRRDDLDILVDLDGFVTTTPIALYARRPAPILVSWFGALSSHGCRLFDYIIGDQIVCPPTDDAEFVETILRMPISYLVTGPHQVRQDVAPSPCLDKGYVTFGSCNRPDKFHQPLIDSWVRIVKQTPGSRLALYHSSYGTEFWRNRICKFLANAGLSADRYTVAVPPTSLEQAERFLGYDQLDIVLDSFPFNAVTTTMDAMRFGVPVVTWRGDAWRGRIGASLLTAAGLGEWVADDLAGYERLANALAMDQDRLVALRQTIQGSLYASPLVDVQRFACDLEALYGQMIAARS